MNDNFSGELPDINYEKKNTMGCIGLFVDAAGTLFKSKTDFSSFFGQDSLELYSDAIPFLNIFKTRKINEFLFKTALITNWTSKVPQILKEFKIEQCFDEVLFPSQYHPPKPNARIFLSACENLHLEPQNCFYFGDSFYDDALGAQAAGLNAIWINRTGMKLEPLLMSRLKTSPVKNLLEAMCLVQEHIRQTLR
jgi:FMN phosphatase YigB (HAD superfamily)